MPDINAANHRKVKKLVLLSLYVSNKYYITNLGIVMYGKDKNDTILFYQSNF